MTSATVKTTVKLNKYYKKQLEYLVEIGELDSVTEGINIAIEKYVKDKQKELYAAAMKKAAQDPSFLWRTIGTQKEFEKFDAEPDNLISVVDSEW